MGIIFSRVLDNNGMDCCLVIWSMKGLNRLLNYKGVVLAEIRDDVSFEKTLIDIAGLCEPEPKKPRNQHRTNIDPHILPH